MSTTSTSSESEKETAKNVANKKRLLDSKERVERKTVEKPGDGARDRDRRVGESTRRDENKDERRPKREREEPAKRERFSERRFREVKERDSSSREARNKDSRREIRGRDSWRETRNKESSSAVRDKESSREIRDEDSREKLSSREIREKGLSSRVVRGKDLRERENSRELGDRLSSQKGREINSPRDGSDWHSARIGLSDRWRGEDGASADQDERGYGRGRGRRQIRAGRYNANDGDRYYAGERDPYQRRQRNNSRGDKWKHDMFESLSSSTNNLEPEEDPVAKVEALLAS